MNKFSTKENKIHIMRIRVELKGLKYLIDSNPNRTVNHNYNQ
jgi:hypothetical protein